MLENTIVSLNVAWNYCSCHFTTRKVHFGAKNVIWSFPALLSRASDLNRKRRTRTTLTDRKSRYRRARTQRRVITRALNYSARFFTAMLRARVCFLFPKLGKSILLAYKRFRARFDPFTYGHINLTGCFSDVRPRSLISNRLLFPFFHGRSCSRYVSPALSYLTYVAAYLALPQNSLTFVDKHTHCF